MIEQKISNSKLVHNSKKRIFSSKVVNHTFELKYIFKELLWKLQIILVFISSIFFGIWLSTEGIAVIDYNQESESN